MLMSYLRDIHATDFLFFNLLKILIKQGTS